MCDAHEHEQYACHDRGDHQSCQSVLLDYAVDDHDERACRSAYLHFAAAEHGYEQSGNDSRNESFRRTNARGYAESDSQRNSYYAYNDTCQCILSELRPAIVAQGMKQFRSENVFSRKMDIHSDICLFKSELFSYDYFGAKVLKTFELCKL